jgi:cytochrome c biogenesis factor
MANSEPSQNTRLSWIQVRHAFVDWRLYLYGLICLGISTGFISLSNFLPSLVESIELSATKAHLMVAPPYALACLCCLVVGYSSSHRNEHSFHLIFSLCTALLGFILVATLAEQGSVAIYISICIACCGTFSAYVILLSWLTNNVGGRTKRAISVGFVVGIGQIGGIVSPLVSFIFRFVSITESLSKTSVELFYNWSQSSEKVGVIAQRYRITVKSYECVNKE